MSIALIPLGLFVLPPLFLLIFYSFENRRLVWLTIPASALGLALCLGSMLADTEGRIYALFAFAPHTAAVIAVTAAAAFVKRKQQQPWLKIPAIVAAVLCAAVLGLASHRVLLDTSNGYRQIFDRPAFTRLTEVQPEDVVRAQVEINGVYSDYRGGMTFFAGLEYAGSKLSEPGFRGDEETRAVRFTLQNGDTVDFFLYRGDKFEVFFIEDDVRQIFYVKSPQLLAGII